MQKFNNSKKMKINIDITLEIEELEKQQERYNKRLDNQYKRYTDDRSIYDKNIESNSRMCTPSAEDDLFSSYFFHELKEKILKQHSEIHFKRFILYYFSGYSMTEIAKIQSKSVMTISNSIRKVKNTIHKIYFK